MPGPPAAYALSCDEKGALLVSMRAPARTLTLAFTTLWCAGWLLVIAASALQLLRAGGSLGSLIVVLVWIGAGLPVLYPMLWAAGGRRETISIGDGRLTITQSVGPWPRTRSFDVYGVRNFHAAPAIRPLLSDFLACREFWFDGAGPVVFEHNGRTYAFGSALDSASAEKAVSELIAIAPFPEGPDVATVSHRSPARTPMLAYLGSAMLVPALTLPFQLAVTDRATCFCDDSGTAPAQPIDVSDLEPAGRISLVPLDGYSPEQAQAIAEYFRKQFGARIRVEPALTVESSVYDARRGQMNAAELLTTLEDRYRGGEGRVVIGLTEADMYIPGAGWDYALTYRREKRVAVVSSARMDRGCLGLLTVDEDRRLARMRKMVGKNIGVMYYRLPLNRDPRSMLYAYADLRELDSMSELF